MLSEDSSNNSVKKIRSKQNSPLSFVTCDLAKQINSIKKTAITNTQLTISKAGILLESVRLWTIGQTNHHTNGLQHRLFLASMWLDKRRMGREDELL